MIILIVAGLATNCGPVAAPGTDEPTPASLAESDAATPITASASSTPEAAIATSSAAPVGPSSAGSSPPAKNAGVTETSLTWDSDPAALIISATFCCGRAGNVTRLNYIPAARLWGDGRLVWTQFTDSKVRRVLEGRLTPEQMQALLQRFNDAGFFGWLDRYADLSIADAAEQCLTIELKTQSQQVCEYFAGAPPAFHELYDHLAAGAGAVGRDYTPELGYLMAQPVQLPANFTPPVDVEWPTALLGVSLDQAEAGLWVKGQTLETSWQIVNAKWQGSIIRDNNSYYSISVQIPGLSYVESPTP